MIFVVVGTHEQPFDRLVREIDRLAAAGELPGEAFCQIGYGEYEPTNVPFGRMLGYEETKTRTQTASLVVTHGGPGCILPALDASRPVVLVPRQHHFAEHVDDHQVAFCRRVGRDRGCPVVEDIADLGPAIVRALATGPSAGRATNGAASTHLLAVEIDRLLAQRGTAA